MVFSVNLNHTGLFVMSRSENSGEVQIVRQDDIIVCGCECHDFRISGIRLADNGPVNCLTARVQEERGIQRGERFMSTKSFMREAE